jgi:secernin
MPYSNSFIIADATEAFILETSGRQYALKKVDEAGSVSNHVAIGTDWDEVSDDAVSFAVSNGWWEDGDSRRLDFAAAYRSVDMAPPQISEERLRQSRMLLEEYRGKVSPPTMMRALRDHYDSGTVFAPGRTPDDGKCFTICMHAEPIGTTTASVIAHLRGEAGATVYWASLGAPCCGVFMPLYIDGEIPQALTRAGSEFSEDSAWWLFKRLNELVAEDYAGRTPRVQEIWSALEADFRDKSATIEADAEKLRSQGEPEQARATLTLFMRKNLDSVLSKLSEITAEFENE